MLNLTDREFLLKAYQLAKESRHPPERLLAVAEPLWSAILADQEKVYAAEVFYPGDKADAVTKLMAVVGLTGNEQRTLYITLEPRASFERLPPVTESIRRLGVKRVVIGADDPNQRWRGEGIRTLKGMGIEVVEADGEEARLCQFLIEDYSKVVQKGLALVQMQGSLEQENASWHLQHGLHSIRQGVIPDLLLTEAGMEPEAATGEWVGIIDLKNERKKILPKQILFQPMPIGGAKKLVFREGKVNLGLVIRELAGMGILRVELNLGPDLQEHALRSTLVDQVFLNCTAASDFVAQREAPVFYKADPKALEFHLTRVRIQPGFLEAGLELC